MRKSEALRLKPGTLIQYGDTMWTARIFDWRIGRVRMVTAGGGVKVAMCQKDWPHEPVGMSEWVPYHFIGSRLKCDTTTRQDAP